MCSPSGKSSPWTVASSRSRLFCQWRRFKIRGRCLLKTACNDQTRSNHREDYASRENHDAPSYYPIALQAPQPACQRRQIVTWVNEPRLLKDKYTIEARGSMGSSRPRYSYVNKLVRAPVPCKNLTRLQSTREDKVDFSYLGPLLKSHLILLFEVWCI